MNEIKETFCENCGEKEGVRDFGIGGGIIWTLCDPCASLPNIEIKRNFKNEYERIN